MKAVNLLPSNQRGAAKVAAPAAPSKAPAGDAFGAYAILGALALVVVAVAALVLTENTIADRKAELARTDQQVQAAAREAAALKPYADFKSLADARVQTVQSLATSRFDWEQTLRDLSRALPRDTRLSSFAGKVGAGDATTAAVASPTIELAGCTSSQTSTAKLMARLRAIRGVSRVSLKSSAKSGSASTGASTGTVGSSTSTLCKKSDAPTFGLTLSFERFNVPVVNAPVGAGAGGATGPTGPTGGVTPAPGTTPTTPASGAPATQGVSTP